MLCAFQIIILSDGYLDVRSWRWKKRRAAAYSARRLRIAGSCRSSGGDVTSPASASGLGDASTVELCAAAGSTVFHIRAGIIADQAALKALQSYVMSVCR
ncbi:lysis system i-spanin subunit Rz [Pseudomonas veronii]|uniref:lysis system i-spanin subunit Rz n=1 Tax=Pseudomonas veronii TaxID=76761 RepID=UPI000F83A6F6|nr:hypothetical protein EKA83_29435 [Pseudomonas veronii]